MVYLIAFSTFSIVFSLMLISKSVMRSWLNPLSIFIFVWGVNLIMYVFLMDTYIEVYFETWVILLISFFMYFFVSIMFYLFINSRKNKIINLPIINRILLLRKKNNKKKLLLVIYFLIFFGGGIFALYLKSLMSLVGLNQILSSLLDARAFMKEEGALPGFHFIYFWEMLLPFVVVYLILFGEKKDWVLFVIALVFTSCLLLTGAKTNFFKAIIWSVIMYLLLKKEDIKLGRSVFYSIFFIFSGITVFFIHTSSTGELQDTSAQVTDVLFRFSAQFATFQSLINDSSIEHSYGKLLFLPITKVMHLISSDIKVPTNILDFYPVPSLFNLATFLDVFYKDFGLFGVIFGPGIFGFLSALIFFKYRNNKGNFYVLFLVSFIFLWTMESPNTAGFVKPSYIFQLFFCYIAYRFIKNKNIFARI